MLREGSCCLEVQKLWILTLLLPGVQGDSDSYGVNYPGPICAVTGSTVIIPCTYKYPAENVEKKMRVVWCVNHEICQGTTPSVYDSEKQDNDPQYTYIGDKKNNCSLKIYNVDKRHIHTYRFRFENFTNKVGFTERSGVNLTVVEPRKMYVFNSSGTSLVRTRDDVILTCRTVDSECSTDQLEITWYHDNRSLSEKGSYLHLISVTTADSGEYSCALKTSEHSISQPYYLNVEENTGPSYIAPVVVAVVMAVVVIITAVVCILKPTKKPSDAAHTRRPVRQQEGATQDVARIKEEVNYASVNFKTPPHQGKRADAEDPVIYSAVAR